MGLLFALAVMLASPQQSAGDPLKDVVPIVGMTYHDSAYPAAYPAVVRMPERNGRLSLHGYHDFDYPVDAKPRRELAGGRSSCYCLRGDYAFLITWGDKNPPEFYVYEKKPARAACLTSFDDLLEWIKKVPDGAKVDEVGSCGRTDWNMPQDKGEQLMKVWGPKMPSAKDGTPHEFYCVCESTSITIFKSLEEGRDWIRNHKGCVDKFTGKPLIAAESK